MQNTSKETDKEITEASSNLLQRRLLQEKDPGTTAIIEFPFSDQ